MKIYGDTTTSVLFAVSIEFLTYSLTLISPLSCRTHTPTSRISHKFIHSLTHSLSSLPSPLISPLSCTAAPTYPHPGLLTFILSIYYQYLIGSYYPIYLCIERMYYYKNNHCTVGQCFFLTHLMCVVVHVVQYSMCSAFDWVDS